MLFTLKLAHRVPAERNRPDVIERRHEYGGGGGGVGIGSIQIRRAAQI